MNKFIEWWKAGEGKHGKLWLFGTAVVIIILLAIFLPNKAEAASLELTCTPPTERADGTPLAASEIQGYKWFRDGVEVGTSGDCTYTMNAPDGTYSITAKTIDTGERESVMSDAVSKTFTTAAPLPPVLQ